MHSRTFRILVLGWITAWFAVIAPGHQRGQVVTAGGDGWSIAAMNSCCASPVTSRGNNSGNPQQSPASGDPVRHCAVCHLVATLQSPPAPDLAPTPLDLCENLPVVPAQSIPGPVWHTILRDRGPPLFLHG